MKILGLVAIFSATLIGCRDDAHVVSRNISKAADNFEVQRRIVFYNGITNEYMLSINGLCNITPTPAKLSVTCKLGPNSYKKHYLGLSDNVTYFVEHLEPSNVSKYFYRVTFKPSVMVPDVRVH